MPSMATKMILETFREHFSISILNNLENWELRPFHCFHNFASITSSLGSISAALSCLVYPPREETAGRTTSFPGSYLYFEILSRSRERTLGTRLLDAAANHVCDVNSYLKFLQGEERGLLSRTAAGNRACLTVGIVGTRAVTGIVKNFNSVEVLSCSCLTVSARNQPKTEYLSPRIQPINLSPRRLFLVPWLLE